MGKNAKVKKNHEWRDAVSQKDHDFGSLVCIYAQILPRIRAKAKQLGYAVAIHGTMTRDLDLLAVPWVEDASSAEDLVQAIAEEVQGYVIGEIDNRGHITDAPTKQQPHGRLSWNICWGGKPFIDLSVMPRLSDAATHVFRSHRQDAAHCNSG